MSKEGKMHALNNTNKDDEYIYDGKTYNSGDSVNILIEIDDYWKINHGKFGWGLVTNIKKEVL